MVEKPQSVVLSLKSISVKAVSVTVIALLPSTEICEVNQEKYAFNEVNILNKLSLDRYYFLMIRISCKGGGFSDFIPDELKRMYTSIL